jgi:hypothetical protein
VNREVGLVARCCYNRSIPVVDMLGIEMERFCELNCCSVTWTFCVVIERKCAWCLGINVLILVLV